MSKIHITIDELILDGASHLDQAHFTHALQQALAQQVAAQGMPPATTVAHVRKDVNALNTESTAQQVTQAIYSDPK